MLQINANDFLCLLAITLKIYFILVLQMLVLLMMLVLLVRCFHVAHRSCPSSREYETSVRSLISLTVSRLVSRFDLLIITSKLLRLKRQGVSRLPRLSRTAFVYPSRILTLKKWLPSNISEDALTVA